MNVPTNLRADQELTPQGKRKVGAADVVQSVLGKTHLWTLLRNNFGSCVQIVGIGKL